MQQTFLQDDYHPGGSNWEGEQLNEKKRSVLGLRPGDKVILNLPRYKEFSKEFAYQKKKVKATVVAIYPHCIHFKTEFGYSVSPAIMVAQEMVSGVEYHGRCPGNERVIGRRAGGKTRKGWKVYE